MKPTRLVVALAIAASGQAAGAATPRMLPACHAGELSLRLDASPHDLDGSSEHGIRLVLINRTTVACRIPGLPTVIFRDAHERSLPIERQIPPDMHPGPVVLPAVVPAGGEVGAEVGWSTAESSGGKCYSPATIGIVIEDKAVVQSATNHVCAPAGQPAMFTQAWFRSSATQRATR